MRQDTQYKNNIKQTYNITFSHGQLEGEPLIQRLETTIEYIYYKWYYKFAWCCFYIVYLVSWI